MRKTALLVCVALLYSAAALARTPDFIVTFPSQLDGEPLNPSLKDVQHYAGRNYVSDSSGNRLAVWGWGVADESTPAFQVCTAATCYPGIAGTAADQFFSPWRISIDAADNLYISQETSSTVGKYDTAGNLLQTYSVSSAHGVHADAAGLGNACDACAFDANNDADGDGLCGDIDAEVAFRKTKVKFDKGDISVHGDLSLPPGYWTDNLAATGTVAITLAGETLTAPPTATSFVFAIKGEGAKKREYEDKDLLNGDVEKLKIDWKGSKFDFHGNDGLKLKSAFIGGTESVLQIETGNLSGPLTIAISNDGADTVISYDALHGISSNVLFEADKPDNKKVSFTLPYQLRSTMSITVSGTATHLLTVGDHYDEGTVKFKLDAVFDPALFPDGGATLPQSLVLHLSLGDTVFAFGQLDTGDWDETKSNEWKR